MHSYNSSLLGTSTPFYVDFSVWYSQNQWWDSRANDTTKLLRPSTVRKISSVSIVSFDPYKTLSLYRYDFYLWIDRSFRCLASIALVVWRKSPAKIWSTENSLTAFGLLCCDKWCDMLLRFLEVNASDLTSNLLVRDHNFGRCRSKAHAIAN